MPFIPNPIGVGAIKAASYAAFGWTVQRGSPVRRNPVLFGLLRTAVGVLVELSFVMLLELTRADGLELHVYLHFFDRAAWLSLAWL